MPTEHRYSSEELVARLPSFLDSLYEIEEYDVAAARALAAEHLLVHTPRHPQYDSPRDLLLQHSEENPVALNRRLRIAVGKVLGKPTGGVKEYSSGAFNLTMHVGDKVVEIHFISAEHRLDHIAEAARAWLAGESLDVWKEGAGYRFVNSPTDEQGKPTDTRNLGVHIYATDNGGDGADEDGTYISISLPIAAGAHPPGVFGNTKEERHEVVRNYLIGELGEEEGSRFIRRYWRDGNRWVSLRGYRGGGSMTLELKHGSKTLLIPRQGQHCDRCGESWVGLDGDACPKCEERDAAAAPLLLAEPAAPAQVAEPAQEVQPAEPAQEVQALAPIAASRDTLGSRLLRIFGRGK